MTGYQIEYSLKKDFSAKKRVTVRKADSLTKTIGKLKAKKTYYVRIRTYKKAGKKTFYSAWSRVKAVKTTRADAAIAAEERIEYGIQAVEALDEAQIADEASALLVG